MSHDHAIPDAEYGVVRRVEPGQQRWPQPASPTRYGVEITVPGECDSCAIKENCYSAKRVVWTTSEEELATGDSVRLEMQPGTILKATGWVYGIPLISVLFGVLAGYFLLFAGRPEQPRVLLSATLGILLMLISGTVLAKLNDWVSERITIRASLSAVPEG